MATSKGQRVASFLLASLFLLSIIGGTVYVVWQIRQQEAGIVDETALPETNPETTELACGQETFETVEPRALPKVTKLPDAITKLATVDIREGNGPVVEAGACVAALYYGTLATTGEKFDGNYETGSPIEFSLARVIPGWTEGIPGMKVGGIRRLEIPAELAYGDQDSEAIPANSDLIFEVEIISARSAN